MKTNKVKLFKIHAEILEQAATAIPHHVKI